MTKKIIIKSNFIEDYCKNKYALCLIIFIFGVTILLHYIFTIKNKTKIIEDFSLSELKEITKKLDQPVTPSNGKTMDISNLLNIDVDEIIRRLFGPRCLPGCMSPDSPNTQDSMCKRVVNENRSFLQCPWRCNIPSFNNVMNENLMFKQDILTNNLKMCSVENQNIDCGGCVPLRIFN